MLGALQVLFAKVLVKERLPGVGGETNFASCCMEDMLGPSVW